MKTYLPIQLASIPTHFALPFSLFLPIGGEFILFRKAGDELSQDRHLALSRHTAFAYIIKGEWLKFLKHLESSCNIEVRDPHTAAENIQQLLLAYERHLEETHTLDIETVNKFRKVALRLVEISEQAPQVQRALLKHYAEKMVYFSSHSANVAIYSLAIGKKLGLGNPDLGLLTFACLVHNIGNLKIPETLLFKKSALEADEWHTIRNHPKSGAELLAKAEAPLEVIWTAVQHHERVDGKGYPWALHSGQIHPFAKICSIADVYDALISHRPYGPPPFSPAQALNKMQGMNGKFDPQILRMLEKGVST